MTDSRFESAEAHLATVATLLEAIQEAAESRIATALDLHETASRLRALLAQAAAHVDAAEAAALA